MFYAVEMCSNGVYTGWITHKNNTVSQEFGLQMKVKA
jgi:hypothetical protein